MMEDKTNIRYVDTNAASVKMTSGVPLSGSPMSDSSIEDHFVENFVVDYASGTSNNHVDGENSSSKENFTASDRIGHISDQLLHKVTIERQIKYVSTNNPSEVEELGRSTSESAKLSNSKRNPIYHSSSNSNASLHKLKVKAGNSRNRASPFTFNSRQTNSQRSEQRDNSEPPTDFKYPENIKEIDTETMNNIKGQMKDRPSSSKSDTPSSEKSLKLFGTKSSNLREQHQPVRLSQSLENSQESVLKQWEDGMVASNSMSALSNIGHKDKLKPTRVNPFNDGLLIDEDHFSDSYENYFRPDRRSIGSTKSSSISQGADWWQEQSDISFAELGLSEDHFSHPQGHFGLSRAEELELAIENCKDLIRDTVQGSDKQKNLVLKLVQLRIKLQEVKEGPEPVPDNVKIILSHKMMLKTSRTSKYYCERCNGAIWGMLQVWYRCMECGYRCHEKCLQQILRTCAKAKVLENPTLVMEICPKEDKGLADQNYRCWECRLAISNKNGHSVPRLCDYTGHYYCEFCHWNDTYIIPARVLHIWDFIPQKVCRASKQFLKLMQKKAVVRIQDINPMLFVYVDQLNQIKKLREEMMIMKRYILSCASAMSAKLLLMLENRQHFVESSDRYSMQDLLDAEAVLIPELTNVHSSWVQHIKVDCQLCQGRGFCCELCGDREVLFPFDSTAVVCAKCSTVLHRHCFAKTGICPRCERREKRKSNGP